MSLLKYDVNQPYCLKKFIRFNLGVYIMIQCTITTPIYIKNYKNLLFVSYNLATAPLPP